MASIRDRAQQALHRALGPTSAFRAQQLEAIEAIVLERQKVLVVQRTGWGKSAVYFIATRLMRDDGAGPTVIVSPLLALMRDQIAMAQRLGLEAVTINSSNRDDWAIVEDRLSRNLVDVLLISPERLNNPDFRDRLLAPLASSAGLLVVDEAHCISDWGHDFRPDYRRIVRVLELLPANVPVLCTTATANERVIADVAHQLGEGLVVLRGTLDRESLHLHVLKLDTQAERLGWLAQTVSRLSGSGIVYCLTVADSWRVAAWLQSRGIEARAYSGETEHEDRLQIEDDLKANRLKVVAATSALGMGFDKPDLGFVVHFQSPDSPVAYYQQVGRAGRAVDRAEVILLAGREDEDIWAYFLENSLPPQASAEEVVALLDRTADWTSQAQIEQAINVRTSRISGLLKILEVEGAVERNVTKWRRTLRPWQFDVERIERVAAHRREEQAAMRSYVDLRGCRMRFLRGQLDDPAADDCGRCDNCAGSAYGAAPPPALVAQAADFLRRQPVSIEPRVRWLGATHPGVIAQSERLETGRSLSFLGDGGWGSLVLEAKRARRHFGDELVAASAELIDRWHPDPYPAAVIFIPPWDQTRDFVPDFARRLAKALSLPIAPCVERVRATQPQKLMQNSQQQLANVDGAYKITRPPTGPVLLVDDVVDSRWTMTVVGAELRRAGSGPVWPFCLARAKG